MPSQSHKRAQRRAAGRKGSTRGQAGQRRLDALSATGQRATEVERSASSARLAKTASRLKGAKKRGASQTVLQVPEKDMGKAAAAMRKVGVKGSVKNIGGTRASSTRMGMP